jgi:Delta3-Delta2-enoyl-CoA isomerase
LTQEIDLSISGLDQFLPLKKMVNSFIDFPKLLIAIVNGPAIGISATIIALCDVIYASENAYFYTPFTALGLCAEGCSSLTFPRILGTSKANEMLNLNHKMTAIEAQSIGFVAKVYQNTQEVLQKLNQIENLPMGSILANKMLMRKFTIDELRKANLAEIDQLVDRMGSEEALMAMVNFQSNRKKSKL